MDRNRYEFATRNFPRFVRFKAKILLHLENAAVERVITSSMSGLLRFFVEYSFLLFLPQRNIHVAVQYR